MWPNRPRWRIILTKSYRRSARIFRVRPGRRRKTDKSHLRMRSCPTLGRPSLGGPVLYEPGSPARGARPPVDRCGTWRGPWQTGEAPGIPPIQLRFGRRQRPGTGRASFEALHTLVQTAHKTRQFAYVLGCDTGCRRARGGLCTGNEDLLADLKALDALCKLFQALIMGCTKKAARPCSAIARLRSVFASVRPCWLVRRATSSVQPT